MRGVHHSGTTGNVVMPNNPYTGSSRGVSGCTSNLFSKRVAYDTDRSKPAVSESGPLEDGEASRDGTISELEQGINAVHLEAILRYLRMAAVCNRKRTFAH